MTVKAYNASSECTTLLVIPDGMKQMPLAVDPFPRGSQSAIGRKTSSHLACPTNPDCNARKVLLVSFECPNWQNARSWSYNGFYAFEEALENHAEVFTLPAITGVPHDGPASWFKMAEHFTQGQNFDQIWIWVTHNDYHPDFLSWLKTKAPFWKLEERKSGKKWVKKEKIFLFILIVNGEST